MKSTLLLIFLTLSFFACANKQIIYSCPKTPIELYNNSLLENNWRFEDKNTVEVNFIKKIYRKFYSNKYLIGSWEVTGIKILHDKDMSKSEIMCCNKISKDKILCAKKIIINKTCKFKRNDISINHIGNKKVKKFICS